MDRGVVTGREACGSCGGKVSGAVSRPGKQQRGGGGHAKEEEEATPGEPFLRERLNPQLGFHLLRSLPLSHSPKISNYCSLQYPSYVAVLLVVVASMCRKQAR